MSDHTKHTVFDFGGEANAKSLDLHAVAKEMLDKANTELTEANDELERTHEVLREMAAQLEDSERETNAWRVLAHAFAAASVLLVIAVVVLAAS
jgi:cellobiose-specific phosphotransferase system component IIA